MKIFEDCGDEKELEIQVSGSTAPLSSPGIFTSLDRIWLTKVVIRFFNACDVTLSVYPHRASLKNMPGHGVNRTYDLWNTSPMLCQLSYAVRSVRVCDISELSLVLSTSMQSSNHEIFLCWCNVLR